MEFMPAGVFFRASPKHEKQQPWGIANRFFNTLVPGRQLLLTMKLTVVLIAAFLLQAHAGSYSQTVTFSGKNIPLEKVFSVIEKQTGYVFFFNYTVLGQAKPVDLKVKNASLNEVLKDCFTDQPLEYEIEGKTISVKKKEITTLNNNDLLVEDNNTPPITISGNVATMDGMPLDGAYILIKGEKNGIVSNAKGDFIIKDITKKNVILVVSFTGYKTKEIPVTDQSFIRVRLEVSTSQLDEVHTIAYGTGTQRYATGNTAKVGAEEIAMQPVSNPLSTLEGRVPGLLITQSSGVPGSSFTIQIRGQNTIRTQNAGGGFPALDNPLFIIDGVPFAPQNTLINQYGSLGAPDIGSGATFNVNYNAQGMGPFNSINPADIESIEVLKDADATSIYGSQGANGVILITTKKGKPGKTVCNANVYTGASVVTRTIPMMNTQQYLQMRHEAYKNDGTTPTLSNGAADLLVFDTTQYTDWKKFLLGGTAHTTDANMSLSGGASTTQFLVGMGYHHEDYIFPGNFGDNRISVNTNLHHSSADRKFSLDLSANYSYDNNNSGGGGSGGKSPLTAFMLSPNYPALVKPDGSINWMYNGIDLAQNPLGYLGQKYILTNTSLLSHLQLSYQVTPGLNIRTSLGYNSFNTREHIEMPKSSLDPYSSISAFGYTSSAGFSTSNYQSWIIEPQADYKRQLGPGKLSALVGGSFQQKSSSSLSVTGTNYTNDALLGSITGAATIAAGDAYSVYKYAAVFGRINYIMADKYILNFTGRRDGSSRFGSGKQFGNFGSVGIGWLFAQEGFIKKWLPAMSYGKLRASYGTTGSDAVAPYQYIPRWSGGGGTSNYLGVPGYTPLNLSNPDFAWAVNKKLELGLELGFWKDALLVNISWFRNRCGNQLLSYPLPSQTGFGSVTENLPAVVQNSGLELTISTTNIKTSSFAWKSSLNLSPTAKNKLLSFPGLASSSYANTYVVGQPLDLKKGYRFLGVNDTTGIYQFLSAKGIPTYTPSYPNDYQVIFNTLAPDFYGGLRNSFSYKGFQLDVFLDFRKQIGLSYLAQLNFIGFAYNEPQAILQRWQKPGDKAEIEKFTTNTSSLAYKANSIFQNSTGAYTDASFIRVKTVSLSYSISSAYLKKLKMQGCRVYLNAQNLFTITGYKGNDPESQSFYGLPPLRTIVAGLSLSF